MNKLKVEHDALVNDYSQLQADFEYKSKQLHDERLAAIEFEEVVCLCSNIFISLSESCQNIKILTTESF